MRGAAGAEPWLEFCGLELGGGARRGNKVPSGTETYEDIRRREEKERDEDRICREEEDKDVERGRNDRVWSYECKLSVADTCSHHNDVRWMLSIDDKHVW